MRTPLNNPTIYGTISSNLLCSWCLKLNQSPPLILMASKDSLKVVDVCKVSPFSDSSEPLSELRLPLTFFDTFWFRLSPVERVFYYRLTESSDPTSFNSVILPKLKHALSLILRHFLPLAGNLTWPSQAPEPFILYTPNDGVSLTVAESESDFDRLSGNKPRGAIESHPLVPKLSISDETATILALQVTLFPGQGFSIGLSKHHSFLDGKSATMFIKAWAFVCKNGDSHPLPAHLTPVFDRTIIQDPDGLRMKFLVQWSKLLRDPNPRNLTVMKEINSPENFIWSTFEFTREDSKKLREKVSLKLNEEEPKSLHLSTFVLVVAYTFSLIVEAKKFGHNQKVFFYFTADVRTRLDPQIPVNYFGNCVACFDASLEAKDMVGQNGVVLIAKRISEAIKGMERGDVRENMKGSLERFSEVEQGTPAFGVAGSPRFNVYGSDFGWGRPEKVEVTSVHKTGAISLAESSDGSGGVEIGLALSDQEEMEVFAASFADGLRR